MNRIQYLFLSLVVFTVSATGATYTVTNTNDSGPGSLREAVTLANSTGTSDVIAFDIAGCPNNVCTITLISGELTVNVTLSAGSLTISNPAGPRRLSISGNNASRIISVVSHHSSHYVFTIDGLTLKNGNASGGWGGAIYNDWGILIVARSEIISNSASTGGGIHSGGYLTYIRDSTVVDNVADWAGGIFAWGWAVVENSTISGNSANSVGAAVFDEAYLFNVTVTQNHAGDIGGLDCYVHKLSGCPLWNSVVSGNSPIDAWLPPGQVGHNNIIGQPALLGPLADNGGPTRTHALLPGSAAINNGSNCILTQSGCWGVSGRESPALLSDQRGVARSTTVDIGAFEFEPGTPFDFDGDNRSDISVFRPSESVWYLNRSTEGVIGFGWGLPTDKMVPADYDGDAKTDIAVFRPSDGRWYIFNSATSTFSSVLWGLATDVPAPGDFDADGNADVAIFRPSDGNWWLNRSTAGTIVHQFGVNGDHPVVGDYDSDGKADIAAFRPSTGVWYIFRSTTGPIGYQFGVGTDKAVPADYDADGKTDIAVYRPSEGKWYIANSGSPTYPMHLFGTATDIPVPGDYDGDGRADIAIFRPSDGNWWIDRTTAGLIVQQFGQNGDKPTPSAFGN